MTQVKRLLAVLAITMSAWAQAPKTTVLTVEQPDAQHTKEELSALLEHYPPSLRGVLALDPNLLGNESYLAPYPALMSFLNAHPDIAHNPAFYVGDGAGPHPRQDQAGQILDIWRDVLNGLAIFGQFEAVIRLGHGFQGFPFLAGTKGKANTLKLGLATTGGGADAFGGSALSIRAGFGSLRAKSKVPFLR